jgi:hypothetical protein
MISCKKVVSMKFLNVIVSSVIFRLTFFYCFFIFSGNCRGDSLKYIEAPNKLYAFFERNKKALSDENLQKKKLRKTITEKKEKDNRNNKIGMRNAKILKKKSWRKLKAQEVETEYSQGKFADLYIQPTWLYAARNIVNEWLLGFDVSFNYATDAYDSKGVNRDIAKLHFSEQPLKLEDFSFPYKLNIKNLISDKNNFKENSFIKLDLKEDAIKEVAFLGREYGFLGSLNFSHYIWRRDVVAGVNIPLGYQKHRLRFDYDGEISTGNKDLAKITEIFKNELRFKGITDFAGSTLGLGDVEIFARVNFKSPYVESCYGGVNITFPTAKSHSNGCLWPAGLSDNEGTRGALFFSALVPYTRIWNPHLFVSIQGSLPATVNKRIPRFVKASTDDIFFRYNDMIDTIKVTTKTNQSLSKQLKKDSQINFFDSEIKNTAHYVSSFKLRKGTEFNVRIGNSIKRFISRRAFFDIFYDLFISLEDRAYGLSREDWKLSVYEDDTQKIGHTVGGMFDYQVDDVTRVKVGINYIFSGKHVLKKIAAVVQCSYSF